MNVFEVWEEAQSVWKENTHTTEGKKKKNGDGKEMQNCTQVQSRHTWENNTVKVYAMQKMSKILNYKQQEF